MTIPNWVPAGTVEERLEAYFYAEHDCIAEYGPDDMKQLIEDVKDIVLCGDVAYPGPR